MKPYLQYLSLAVILATMVGTYAVGQDHIGDNKLEIEKLKKQTENINLTEYQIKELSNDMTEIKDDLKKILRRLK